MKKTLIVATILSLTLPLSAMAGGGGVPAPAGATLPEQIVQEATNVNQLTQQITMTSQQLQMLRNQALNLQSLPSQLWPNVSGQLQNLIGLVNQAQGLNYAAQNTAAQVQQIYGNTGTVPPNYESTLQQWTANTNSQIASTLQQYGMQAQNFQSEQASLQSLENASQTSTGRMQALQAGNQIAGMQVNQMQQLRQTIMSGNQVMMNAIGNKANQAQQDRNVQNQFLATPPSYGW
ncbi:MAG: P-type conjugative transfer protein TrbJ [Burkholderiales bacterium]